jgi:hypothetical protein
MVMDFRVNELITNRTAWCFVIITILPYDLTLLSQQGILLQKLFSSVGGLTLVDLDA